MKPFRKALVTGASSGLGRAICRELAARGVEVVACARRGDKLEDLVRELEAAGARASSLRLDVTSHEAVRGAIASAGAEGPLDLVVAGAGVAEHSIEAPDRAARTRQLLEVNLLGAVTTIEAGIEAMAGAGGTVGVLSSLAGTRGLPGAAAYCASKAAIIAYIEARQIELSGHPVRLVDVQPGFVRTPMTAPNEFPMPLLMEVDVAARRTVDGLEAGRAVVSYPRRLAWPLRVVARSAPRGLWRRLLARRKDRPGRR